MRLYNILIISILLSGTLIGGVGITVDYASVSKEDKYFGSVGIWLLSIGAEYQMQFLKNAEGYAGLITPLLGGITIKDYGISLNLTGKLFHVYFGSRYFVKEDIFAKAELGYLIYIGDSDSLSLSSESALPFTILIGGGYRYQENLYIEGGYIYLTNEEIGGINLSISYAF